MTPGHWRSSAAEVGFAGGPEVRGEDAGKGLWSVMSETSPPRQPSSTSVDPQGDSSLQVEISDAVSERDKVKFTVQTKVRLPGEQEGSSDACLRSLLPPAFACPRGWWADADRDFGPCSSTWPLPPAPCPSEKASILSSLQLAVCLWPQVLTLPPVHHPE